jgi:hypothetical protein
MKELLFYLVIGIILYYVLTLVIEKYYSQTENFDPSLVPVSSIVSLAKVAQKIVNGNGVLKNPGNLQIGSSSTAPGNLTVTGNSNFNGSVSITNNWLNGGPIDSSTNRLKFDTDTSISSSNNIYLQSTKSDNPVTNMTLDAGNLLLNGNITLSKIDAPNTSKLSINSQKLLLDSPNITFGSTTNSGVLSINGGLSASGPATFSALTVKGPLSAYGYQITDSITKSNNFTWKNPILSLNLNDNSNNTIFNIDKNGNISAKSLTTNNLTFNGTESLVYDQASDMIKVMNADGTAYSPSGFTASSLYSSNSSNLNSLSVTNNTTFNTLTSPNQISFGILKDSNNSIEFLSTGNINYKSPSGHIFSNGTSDQMIFDPATSTLTINGDLHVTRNFNLLVNGRLDIANKSDIITSVKTEFGGIRNCTTNNTTEFYSGDYFK